MSKDFIYIRVLTRMLENNAFSVLHYITLAALRYIASRFIPPWNFHAQLSAAASQRRKTARCALSIILPGLSYHDSMSMFNMASLENDL